MKSYDNFFTYFIKPTVNHILLSKSTFTAEENVRDIALKLGVGDDVSLSFIVNKKTKVRYYR